MKSKNIGLKLVSLIKIILFGFQGGLLALKCTIYKEMSWLLVFSPIIIYVISIVILFLCIAIIVILKLYVTKIIKEIEKEKNDNKTNNSS
jgi:hypothetical protein